MRLLLLEDDHTLGEGLRDFLQHDGYLVDWCTTLAQARGLITEPYDAWLLDWNLPDGSGVDWLRSLRAKGLRVPALLLTARDRLSDRIEGLDSGADAYLSQPVEPAELLATIRALLRLKRAEQAAERAYRAGAISYLEWAQLQAMRIQARQRQLDAAVSAQSALIEIQRLTGQPLVANATQGAAP